MYFLCGALHSVIVDLPGKSSSELDPRHTTNQFMFLTTFSPLCDTLPEEQTRTIGDCVLGNVRLETSAPGWG